MCGVVAWVKATTDGKVDESTLRSMTATLHHRGPDGEGFYIDGNVGLGHKRLSILDVENGKQPLESDGVVLSYNGEIYNFKQLKCELEALGHVFASQCDSEVLLFAWKEWGVSAVHKLRGMFAFVIYDKPQNTLFVARDRLGIKPLHWARTSQGDLLFASELKAITAHPDIEKQLNPCAIEDFFSLGYVADPKTIFKDVSKLPPAHVISIDLSDPTRDVTPKCYWEIENFVSDEITREQDIGEEFARLTEEAITLRMVADVPLGSFLSGGIDSSVISAVMQKHSEVPINTFSIGFDLSKYDESFYAKQLATQLGFKHLNTSVSINDLTFMETLVDIYDEPFADNSAIPTFILSGVAAQHVKVALSGDGADELLYGYRNHKMLWVEEKIRKCLPDGVRKKMFGTLAKLYPNLKTAPKFLRGKTTLNALSGSAISSYHNAISITHQNELARLYAPQLKAQLHGYSSLNMFDDIAKKCKSTNSLKAIQLIDFKTYLAGGILTKVDRASMKNSLEVRVPYLDHHLVERTLAASPSLNLSWGQTKRLLVNGFKHLLPSFVTKRNKMGFSSPIDEWLRQIPKESLKSKLSEGALAQTGLFSLDGISILLDEHHERGHEHGMTIWSLLIFNAFLEKHFGTQKSENIVSP